MKRNISRGKEEKRMTFKRKSNILDNLIIQKINNDINCAKRERANGDMGTPIEEVLANMKKIVEGEAILDNENFNF